MPRTIKSKPSTSRMTLRTALFLLAANTAPSVLSESCSCTPTKYSFRLSLSQGCSINDIADNDGVDESLCFVEPGVTLPSSAGSKRVKSLVDQSIGGDSTNDTAAAPASTDNAVGDDGEQVRRSRQLSSTPVEIISIQYLEFDTSGDLNVIYTDDSFIETDLSDGDVFEFYSTSSMPGYDAENSVGGASLILYGRDEAGETIRNRFFWTFEDCKGALTGVKEGDRIGWVTLEDISGPYPKNCPGLPEDSPTISPRTDEPTYEPTYKPTPSPGSVSWGTPSPNSAGAKGSDDESGTSSDGSHGGSNDVNSGSNDSDGETYGSASSDGYYGPSKPSPDTKAGKPVYSGKSSKHSHDTSSFDGGHYPVGKSSKAFGKSGKYSKASSTSTKENNGYSDDSRDADDDYSHSPRHFSEINRNGENIR